MEKLDLCNFTYSRQQYCILIHEYSDNALKPVTCYFSPGTDEQNTTDAVEEYLIQYQEQPNISVLPDHLIIEDDDNVLQMMQKVEIVTRYRRDFMYFYIASGDGTNATNMCFDLSYIGSNKELRKFNYSVKPSKVLDERIENSAAWEKSVEKHDFISSMVSKFQYPNKFNVINCVPINQYITWLRDGPAGPMNPYLLRTYYPIMTENMRTIFTNIKEGRLSDIKHVEDGKEYKSILDQLKQSSQAIKAINDTVQIQQLDDIDPDDGDKLICGTCNISEAIIHINYNEQNENFVDLGKIFHMFQMSEMVPFIRFKSELDKDSKYKVYSSLTDKSSSLFIDKTTLLDWTNTKYKKRVDNTDTHAIYAQVLTKTSGSSRGLSFKIYNYGEGRDRKYITVNVYKDGKIEIKCSWEEKSGGTPKLVTEALNKVGNFIEEINKLQYYTNGAKKRKITVLTAENTHIAFYNTITTIDLGIPLDYDMFWKHMSYFKSAYITRVARRGISGQDKRSVEMRYKRVHNYIQLNGIYRFIKSYKDANPRNDFKGTDREYNMLIINELADIFNYTEEDSRKILDQHDKEYEGKTQRIKGQPDPISKDEIGKRIGRSMIKQPGIDIKIIKKDFDKKNDHKYKCLILGITENMIGPIFNFIRSLMYYYRYNDYILNLKGPNTYKILLGNRIEAPDNDEEEGYLANSEQVINARPALIEEPYNSDSDFEYDRGIGQLDDNESAEIDQPTEAEVVKPPKKVVIKKMSMLEIMKVKDPILVDNINKLAKSYSRACQKNDYRQPLVIGKKTRDELKAYIDNEKLRINAALAIGPDPDLTAHLAELNIHSMTIESGAEYRGNFYFCPLTWDYMNDNEGAVIKLPRLDEAMTSSNYYYPDTKHWLSGTHEKWKLNKVFQQATPPHPWYLSFVDNMGTPEANNCAPCCFKTILDRSRTRREACLAGETKIGIKIGDYSYIKSQNKPIDNKRYGFIPDKINHIFKTRDDNLSLKDGKIAAGFSCYLRRGVSPRGNFFLNCLNELMPSEKNLIKRIIDWLTQMDKDMSVYKSLKKGALFQLFMPGSDESQNEVNETLADSNISRDRFIAYLKDKENEINEDFLWDLLSYPGVIMASGLNIVICNIIFTKNKHNQVEFGKIKCPVGFDYKALYDIERPTIVLYKYYNNRYEIICHVTAGANRDIHTEILFQIGNPLVTSILERIKSHCVPLRNEEAVSELRNHIKNVTMSPTSLDNEFLEPTVIIDLHTAIEKLNYLRKDNPTMTAGYVPKLQIVDSYTKVTHLILENNMWVPVAPSGISGLLPYKRWTDVDLPLYRNVVQSNMQLYSYANFGEGYIPVAFLLDPGENLDDPADDIIIGVLLKNGLITFTDSELVSELTDDNKMLDIEDLIMNKGDNEYGNIIEPFNLKDLLFTEKTEDLWYDDYKKADEELMMMNKESSDLRLIYAVRSDFEHECYHKFRYEFSKILTYSDNNHKEHINSILEAREDITIAPHKKFDDQRHALIPYITNVMKDYVTDKPNDDILQAIGPINIGYDDLINDPTLIEKYKFNYVLPNIRYSCSDIKLSEYRKSDIHCIVSDQDKLFISPVNLLTGAPYNFDNYVARLVEELIRIPLKRSEIMSDQVDNFVTNIPVMRDKEHYLNSEDLFEDIRKIYETGIDYQRKMREHYDVVNPVGYIEPDDENVLHQNNKCRSSFVNLPKALIYKLKTLSFKILSLEGSNQCIYEIIDQAIRSIDNTNKYISTLNTIANIIDNEHEIKLEDHGNREGWQLARDFYARIWGKDYSYINNREALIKLILLGRHHISVLDLSLISRAFDVRFIILHKPVSRLPEGISCLGTTQSTSANYIILYLQGLDNYNIVVNTKFSPPKKVFTEAELSDPNFGAKAIFDVWLQYCGDDNKQSLDPVNFLFRSAPRPIFNDKTGRVVQFTDNEGNTIPSIKTIKAKLKSKNPLPIAPPIAPPIALPIAPPLPKVKAKIKKPAIAPRFALPIGYAPPTSPIALIAPIAAPLPKVKAKISKKPAIAPRYALPISPIAPISPRALPIGYAPPIAAPLPNGKIRIRLKSNITSSSK